jgi:hypothetical protein
MEVSNPTKARNKGAVLSAVIREGMATNVPSASETPRVLI